MSNLFQKTSSSWVRYDKYEWKEDKEGTLYITPSPDAKVSFYNPLKDSEQMVLKAVNLGLICMDKNNTQEQLQDAIISVGYRVNSIQTTRFRIWATSILKEYMIKGFAMDDERLKQGKTAAEIVYNQADHTKENMGLITWKNASDSRILKSDTPIAKNYLDEKQIRQLEHAVTGYSGIARKRKGGFRNRVP